MTRHDEHTEAYLYVTAARKALAPLAPLVSVKQTGLSGRVSTQTGTIAELRRGEARLVPSGEWKALRLPEQAAQLRISVGFALVLLGHDIAVDHLVPARVQEPVLDEPVDLAAGVPDRKQTIAEAWCTALNRRGAPARVVDGTVFITGVGTAAPPPGAVLAAKVLRREARALVRRLTDASRDALLDRAKAATLRVPGVWADFRDGKVVVTRHGRELARIERFRIMTAQGAVMASGDLLDHAVAWTSLRAAVAAAGTVPTRPTPAPRPDVSTRSTVPPPALRSTSSQPARSSPTVLLAFPASLPAPAREAAMAASEKLRTDRRLVPAVTVEVHTPQGNVAFVPLDEKANPLEARFTFEAGGARVRGGLRLKRPGDPLALHVIDGPDPKRADAIGHAWATALVVYAELTCHAVARSPAVARPSHQRRRVGGGPARPASSSRGRRTAQPTSFEFEGSLHQAMRMAAEHLSEVSGYVRRLPAGQRSSDDAAQAARAVGITIPSGHTYVRPHTTGRGGVVRVRLPRSQRLW